jgi:hypothetical protein
MKETEIKNLQDNTPREKITPNVGGIKFQSVTRMFLASEKCDDIFCPYCGSVLNFGIEVEWMGPDAFLCGTCNRLLNISLIHRALRDLGVE